MINNPKMARIVAVVVIAMLVVTLAASLFGCAADDHYQSFRRIAADGGTKG